MSNLRIECLRIPMATIGAVSPLHDLDQVSRRVVAIL